MASKRPFLKLLSKSLATLSDMMVPLRSLGLCWQASSIQSLYSKLQSSQYYPTQRFLSRIVKILENGGRRGWLRQLLRYWKRVKKRRDWSFHEAPGTLADKAVRDSIRLQVEQKSIAAAVVTIVPHPPKTPRETMIKSPVLDNWDMKRPEFRAQEL